MMYLQCPSNRILRYHTFLISRLLNSLSAMVGVFLSQAVMPSYYVTLHHIRSSLLSVRVTKSPVLRLPVYGLPNNRRISVIRIHVLFAITEVILYFFVAAVNAAPFQMTEIVISGHV